MFFLIFHLFSLLFGVGQCLVLNFHPTRFPVSPYHLHLPQLFSLSHLHVRTYIFRFSLSSLNYFLLRTFSLPTNHIFASILYFIQYFMIIFSISCICNSITHRHQRKRHSTIAVNARNWRRKIKRENYHYIAVIPLPFDFIV